MFLLDYTCIDIYFVTVHTAVLDDKKVKIKGFLWFDSPRYKKLSMAPISKWFIERDGTLNYILNHHDNNLKRHIKSVHQGKNPLNVTHGILVLLKLKDWLVMLVLFMKLKVHLKKCFHNVHKFVFLIECSWAIWILEFVEFEKILSHCSLGIAITKDVS